MYPTLLHYYKNNPRDFPGGAVVKNPPANAGDTCSSPGPGRSHMLRNNWAPEPQLMKPTHLESVRTLQGRVAPALRN